MEPVWEAGDKEHTCDTPPTEACSCLGANRGSLSFWNTESTHLPHSCSPLILTIRPPIMLLCYCALSSCVLVSWATSSQEARLSLLRNNTSNGSTFTPRTLNQISAFAFRINNWKSPNSSFFFTPFLWLMLLYSMWHKPSVQIHGFLSNSKEVQEQSIRKYALVLMKL